MYKAVIQIKFELDNIEATDEKEARELITDYMFLTYGIQYITDDEITKLIKEEETNTDD